MFCVWSSQRICRLIEGKLHGAFIDLSFKLSAGFLELVLKTASRLRKKLDFCYHLRYTTPAYDKSDPNRMVYVLFDRRYSQDDIVIYVRQNTTELVSCYR